MTMFGWSQALFVLLVLVALHVPLGDYMAQTLDGGRHLKAERWVYRICGVDPDGEQDWRHYLAALMAFSVASIVVLFALLTLQRHLPWSLGHGGMPWQLALHTAVSFTTNTSWQNYAGESTTGHLAVMAGLGVQAFASAAVGLCVGLALIRGLIRRGTDELGNFWVDLTRSILRVLLPLAVVFGLILIGLGVEQNLTGAQTVSTVAGGHQTIIGGPVGSWEPIKLMTGDGGGFFNASSGHPFENPSAWSNSLSVLLMLLIPTAFVRYTSNVNSNGSAMAGLSGNTPFYNLTMTAAMFIGRYLPIAFVLALAGRLARQQPGAVTVGTLRTSGVNFVVLATGAALILALLNFLPALSLGTLADGLG
jgi:K+-transporting ATPase ATPase A chain